MAKYIKANVNDTVWIHGVDTEDGNPLCEVKVVHVFELYGREHYVVERETYIDPILFVRDGVSITDDPNKPIGLWRRD